MRSFLWYYDHIRNSNSDHNYHAYNCYCKHSCNRNYTFITRITIISHEQNQFEEPLFALVPSVGISAVNKCPSVLNNYYKKPCLLALSLYGNSLRPGKSLIIYLLNEGMNQVHSIEKIILRDHLKLRHFLTNSKNELYEDKDGNIYISADNVGIYQISFVDFTN